MIEAVTATSMTEARAAGADASVSLRLANGAVRIVWIGVEIGALGHVDLRALAFCFASAARGTIAENAELVITFCPGGAFCFICGQSAEIAARLDPCPVCVGGSLRVESGEEMKVTEMEIV